MGNEDANGKTGQTEAERIVYLIENFVVAIVRDERSESIDDYFERSNMRAALVDAIGSTGAP